MTDREKYLIQYLPYNLMCERINYKHEKYKILTAYDFIHDNELDNLIPQLRSLEDLYNEISVETETFIPTVKLEIYKYPAFNTRSKLNVHNLPHHVFVELLKLHFDVFGLLNI